MSGDPLGMCQVGLIAINLIGEAVDEHAPFSRSSLNHQWIICVSSVL
jgi:hypothetical protein